MWLFVVFLAVPLIEIALFIQIGGAIGLWWTLAIVIFTAVLGTWQIRTQGVLAMDRLRTSLNELSNPTEPLAHGAMILIAGALLLTPGFFTDAIGFLLLLPPVRSAVYAWLRARVKVQNLDVGTKPPRRAGPADTVIEGEYEELDPSTESPRSGNSGWTRH